MFEHLPSQVADTLSAYYQRKRLYHLMRVLFATAIIYLLLALVGMHLDRFLFLKISTRVNIFWTAHGVAGAVGGVGLIIFFLRGMTARQVAYELESRLSDDAEERFVTLEALRARSSAEDSAIASELISELETSTHTFVQTIRSAGLVQDRILRIFLTLFLIMILVYGAFLVPEGYQFRLMIHRFLFPSENLPKPSFIEIAVKSEHLVLGKGEELVIQAEISGEMPTWVRWILGRMDMSPNRCVIASRDENPAPFEFAEAAQSSMTRLMRDIFLYSKGDLQNNLQYRIRCGDAETAMLSVEVVAQPRFVELKMKVTPPQYAGLPAETVSDLQRPLRFLPGSKIEITFKTDQSVPTRSILLGKSKEPEEPEWDDDNNTGTYEFELKEKTRFEITVKNKKGFANVEPARAIIGIREDAPPTVRLQYPVADLEKVSAELVPFHAIVEDDLGVAEVALRFILNPSVDQENASQEITVPLEGANKRLLPVKVNFDLEKTEAVPGDVVAVQVRARDIAGNDNVSRKIQIRVVSFTRGENERLRLAALRFLSQALEIIATEEISDETIRELDRFRIDSKVFEEITRIAKETGIEIENSPSMRPLLELLEREQHFTDSSKYKHDLRWFYGALLSACIEGEKMEVRNGRFQEINKGSLTDLINFRWLKNLTWRLFGMKYEAGNIHDRLSELKSEGGGRDLSASMKRRAMLYLKGIQDIGDEMIQLSRRADALDESRIKEFIGEVNTAAYYIGRGSVTKRQASALDVGKQIGELLASLRPVYSVLLQKELDARSRLSDLYREALSKSLSLAPSEWLEADGRLMVRNPFTPLWPQARNLALSAENLQPGRAKEFLEPGPQLLETSAAGGTLFDSLALDWELSSIMRLEGISDRERSIAVSLLKVESEAARIGWSAEKGRRLLEAFGMIRDVEQSRPAISISETHLPDTAERYPFLDPSASLQALLQKFKLTGDKINAAVRLLKSTDEGLAKTLADCIQSARYENGQLKRLLREIEVSLSRFGWSDSKLRQQEILLLKLRSAFSRYLSRVEPALKTLTSTDFVKLGAGEITTLDSNMGRLKFLHESLGKRLESHLREMSEGTLLKKEERERYVLLEAFERTRDFVRTCVSLLSSDGQAETAKNLLQRFPEVAPVFLSAHANHALDTQIALNKAKAVLEQAEPMAAEFVSRVSEADGEIQVLRAAVEQAGPGELQARMAAIIGRLQGKLKRLTAGTAFERVAVQRKRFALEDILLDIARLLNEFKDMQSETALNSVGFRGGPDDIWSKEHRYQAEVSRRRLMAQAAHAQDAIFLGVTEGLKKDPDEKLYHRSLGWSLFLYRLVRSELAGGAGVRAIRSKDKVTGDPHLRFLKSELEKARQVKNLRNYAEPTKEYLDSVADFLRY